MQEKESDESTGKGVIILLLITVILTGINGLITYAFLIFLSRIDFARDPDQKHGLVSGKSRLGGLAIIFSVVFGIIVNLYILDNLSIESISEQVSSLIFFSILIGLIGFAEDMSQKITSKIRLVVMLTFIAISLMFMPELIPLKLEIFHLASAPIDSFFIYLFTVIMICGFVNAGNIADGANGLLGSIFLGAFLIIYSIEASMFNFSIIISTLAFVIYNVSTGRIFLGDFGAYSLSALVAFKCLEIYMNNNISVFLFASILIYPCFEITRSILLRFISKTSLMSPDNYHFHNYYNDYLLSFGLNKHITNSITGLSIAFITSGPPVFLFLSGTNKLSVLWLYLFLIEIACLSGIYLFFVKKIINIKVNH